jgi:hypothetical protein
MTFFKRRSEQMSNLKFMPEAASQAAPDKHISVPAIDRAADVGPAANDAHSPRALRRRYGVSRLAHPTDDGFRPFRVY